MKIFKTEHHDSRWERHGCLFGYIVHVQRDGTIKFASESADFKRLQNKVFTSPSLAAKAASGYHMNGWWHWTFERSPGEWVKLNELRK